MRKKSTTQMTKKDLQDLVKAQAETISDLEKQIEQLQQLSVQSAAVPLTPDVSGMLTSMNNRIKQLEDEIQTHDKED